MRPETQIRFARVLMPLALVIGIAAVVLGNIYTALAMVLLLVGQTANFVAARRKLGRSRD